MDTRDYRKCCLKRMHHLGWCTREDGHSGLCQGKPRPYLPDIPEPDRALKSAFRKEITDKWKDWNP